MTYLITGATGLVGKALVRTLLARASGAAFLLPVRDKRAAEAALRALPGAAGADFTFAECDLAGLCAERFPAGAAPDRLIHCAAPTASAFMVSHPVETADAIVRGTRNALALARRFRVGSMVYLSSMEVYGVVADVGRPRTEEELGEIDPASPRSSYPLGKRMAEHYCHAFYREYGVPVKIARLAQTFGRGAKPEDNRVFMQFARAVKAGEDIVLRTQGKSLGNYCALDDAVEAILTILEKGADGEVYNVVNEALTMPIAAMAALAASELAGGRVSVKICPEAPEKTGYAPDTGLRMSAEKLRRLGWTPARTLADMYRDVLEDLDSAAEVPK